MISQKWIKKIIKEVAVEYKLPEFVVEELFTKQFKYVKEIISKTKENEKYPVIMLPCWGKYYASERKIKYIKTRNERKNIENIPEAP
jgi:hypothetical protein